MKSFALNEHYTVVCEWKKTRMAFKHEATILRDGVSVYTTKICYQNRTWESYEYQSVLHKAIEKYFDKAQAKAFMDKVDGKGVEMVNQDLGMIAGIAKLGNLLCEKPEEKNAWKLRMLKAGLANKGLSFPDDWDTLPEAEKQRRLDGAIATMTEGR